MDVDQVKRVADILSSAVDEEIENSGLKDYGYVLICIHTNGMSATVSNLEDEVQEAEIVYTVGSTMLKKSTGVM
jgi:hypothetical protein